jgi:tetratricopeptide (TPR) repeat protein
MTSKASVRPAPRHVSLLRFLDQDPQNLSLLADTASAAATDGAHDLAAALLDRHEAIAPLPPALLNQRGLIAIAQQRFGDAQAVFETLRDQEDDPALRFNLAWCKAMTGAYRQALDLLDDKSVKTSPQAPALKIQMLHHLGLYDEGLACGRTLAQTYPGNQALMAALSAFALDAGDSELAAQYAAQAGTQAEGQAVMGLIALGEYHTSQSLTLFEQALQQEPENPRAWLGKGLALLVSQDAKAGAQALDKGATLFSRHIGSWIAAGWAYFVCGDRVAARARFETALALDENFAESHGGLAVLDALDGDSENARKRCEIALRLDRNCMGAVLAKSLLLEQKGHPDMARKIRETAMTQPVGPQGQTLMQALVGFGTGRRT